MAIGNRVDFDPSFKRDVKKILDSYKAEKADIAEELHDEKVFEEVTADDKPIIDPATNTDDIQDIATFREYIDDLAAKFEDVDERTEVLLENLSDFNIQLPDTLYNEMLVLKGYTVYDKPPKEEVLSFTKATADCMVKVLTKSANEFTAAAKTPEKYESAINEQVIKRFPKFGLKFLLMLILMSLKASMWNIFRALCVEFRKIRIKVGPFKFCLGCPISKLFKALVSVVNGMKIGAIGQDGDDVQVKEATSIRAANGQMVALSMSASYVDDASAFMWWGSGRGPKVDGQYLYQDYSSYAKSRGWCAECPPTYSFTLVESDRKAALEGMYRQAPVVDGVHSICQAEGEPTPEELAAIKMIETEIIKMAASQSAQDAKASEYITAKKNWNSIKNSVGTTINNSVNAYDPTTAKEVKTTAEKKKSQNIAQKMGDLFEVEKTDTSEADTKHNIDTINTVKDLRAVLASKKGDTSAAVDSISSDYGDNFIDGTTKAMLQGAMGMLKFWDGMVSGINNIYTMCPLEKDLICCLLNAFTAVTLDINGPTASADFKHAQEKAKAIILFVLRLIKLLLDLRVGRLASDMELSFITLDGLLSSIQNAIIETIVTGLAPYVDKLSGELHEFLSLKSWAADCKKKTKEAQEAYDNAQQNGSKDQIKRAEGELYFRKKLCEAKLNCKPLNFLLSMADCELAKTKLQFMDWLIGLKLKTNDSAQTIEIKVKQSSEARLLFVLGEIIDGMITSLEKGFEGFFSFCSGNNDLNPFGVPTIEQSLANSASLKFNEDGTVSYNYQTAWKTLPSPVFDPTVNVGIEDDDPVDLAFNQPSAFYEPTYLSMPEYKKFIHASNDKIESSQLDIAKDIYVSDIPAVETMNKQLDETYRDCSSDDRVRILFDMLMKANTL